MINSTESYHTDIFLNKMEWIKTIQTNSPYCETFWTVIVFNGLHHSLKATDYTTILNEDEKYTN